MTAATKSKKPAGPMQTCEKCGTGKPSRRGKNGWALPNGWTRLSDAVVCRKCKNSAYVVRAVALTVSTVRVEGIDWDGQNGWADFRRVFWPTQRAVTRLRSWAYRELYAQDPIRDLPYTGDTSQKLPGYDQPYLYGDRRSKAIAPGMSGRTRDAVLADCQKHYMKRRLLVFLAKEQLPTPRSNSPVPFGNSGQLGEEDGRFHVLLNIGGIRFKLRFAGGHRHRRQLGTLRRIMRGEVIARSFALQDLSAGQTQHRPLIKKGKRLVCKIAVLMPKEQHEQEPDKTLYVSTGLRSLLHYGCANEPTRRLALNADHVRRRRLAHRERLDRLMQDRKCHRKGTNVWRDIDDKIDQLCALENRWLADFCHQTSRMLADFAVRNRVARIEYDETNKGFVTEFPWYKLAQLIEQKADAAGIKFIKVGEGEEAEVASAPATTG